MPYRVQRIEEFVKQLETGDLKLRVRVLEVTPLWTYLLVLTLLYILYDNWFEAHDIRIVYITYYCVQLACFLE